jgi:hypothetical protein
MKTNLLKIIAFVRIPEEWDHEKCAALRADPNGYPTPTHDDPNARKPFPPGPIDQAILSSLDDLAAKLAAINPAIELAREIQR